MTAELHTIEADEFLAYPASRVWQALTDRAELAEWFMASNFRPEVGHDFTLDSGRWGQTHCTVIAAEPYRLLRYTWRNGPLDTVVTWQLIPEGKGTRLLLSHHGFDLSDPAQRRAFDGMSGGWRSTILPGLRSNLTRTDPTVP